MAVGAILVNFNILWILRVDIFQAGEHATGDPTRDPKLQDRLKFNHRYWATEILRFLFLMRHVQH